MAASNVFFAALAGAVLMVMGWGVRGLLYGSIASAVATLLIYAWLVKKLIPEFTLNPLRADLEEAKKIFAFSWRIYLVQASAAIQNHLEKILLAVFVGVVPVGWYDIASDTASKVRGVPGLMLSPILPAAAELDARGEEGKLFELYSRAHKYLAFVAVPLIFFSAMISTRFIDLWLGVRFNVVALPFAVLLIVNLINLTTGPGFMISVGQGQLWQGVRSAVTGIAVGVPLSIFLIHRYGFAGAVIGTSCSSIVSSMLFFYFFHHHTGYPGIKLLREAYLKPILCSIVLLTAEFFIFLPYGPTWFGLVLEGAVFAFLYATILLYFNFFDHYDWGKIEGLFPIARLARRIAPLA
jgi:O-antigen/teichoic acid export membrane protein